MPPDTRPLISGSFSPVNRGTLAQDGKRRSKRGPWAQDGKPRSKIEPDPRLPGTGGKSTPSRGCRAPVGKPTLGTGPGRGSAGPAGPAAGHTLPNGRRFPPRGQIRRFPPQGQNSARSGDSRRGPDPAILASGPDPAILASGPEPGMLARPRDARAGDARSGDARRGGQTRRFPPRGQIRRFPPQARSRDCRPRPEPGHLAPGQSQGFWPQGDSKFYHFLASLARPETPVSRAYHHGKDPTARANPVIASPGAPSSWLEETKPRCVFCTTSLMTLKSQKRAKKVQKKSSVVHGTSNVSRGQQRTLIGAVIVIWPVKTSSHPLPSPRTPRLAKQAS